MNAFLLSFINNDQDEQIAKAMDIFPDWARLNNRTWIVLSNKKSTDVRSIVLENTNQPVQFIVINITNSAWASHGIDKEITTWMKDRIK